MVSIEYANAYSEVLEILNYIPREDYNKISKDMIKLFRTNKNKEYNFSYDVNKTLTEQNVSKKAKTIIAILFRDYWATEQQREKILAKERYDMEQWEKEKREKYNPNNIFKKFEKIEQNENIESNKISNLPVEVKKEKFYKKIINIIKKVFHIKNEQLF